MALCYIVNKVPGGCRSSVRFEIVTGAGSKKGRQKPVGGWPSMSC